MTVEELEAEVSRLRTQQRASDEREILILNRLLELDREYQKLLRIVDETLEDARSMGKSLRWLLAKARGEETL